MADLDLTASALHDFALTANTASREVKADRLDSIQIEVGDSKQADFKPQFKVMRWDNEVNFSIRAAEHPSATAKVDGAVFRYITPDYEVHQYEAPQAGEDGGFEFEWMLPSAPPSNVLVATVQFKNCVCFVQLPLTQEEIDLGRDRPEHVVGSYAVYHASVSGAQRLDGPRYKTGKVCHIYRPKAIDAQGAEMWCDLAIDADAGALTVTVPQTFLDEAAYPVRVDPTFGYTSIGATGGAAASGFGRSSSATLSEAGTLESLSVYVDATSPIMKMAIYTDSSGPNALIQGSAEQTVGASGWTVFDITDSAQSAGTFWLAMLYGNSVVGALRFDTAAFGTSNYATISYPTVPDPWPAISSESLIWSMYCTYSTGGATGNPWNAYAQMQ